VSPRILVVEDEYLIAQDIADALEAGGFEVLGPCPTVDKALTYLRDSARCDAAVLDVSLRNHSSLPVAKLLTERGIPFAVVTGFSPGQLPSEMAGVPVLAKPWDNSELVRVIKRLIAPG
jgi:DNA-binding response OmpR family regulator